MLLAAETFELHPTSGSLGKTRIDSAVAKVFSPLQNSVFLIEDNGVRVALLMSHLMTHYYPFSNPARRAVAEALGIPFERVLCFSSHNHCTVQLSRASSTPNAAEPEYSLTTEAETLIASYVDVARRLSTQLCEVEVRYGRGHERRITHNRKGRRADGSTFLMREEDRLEYGDDYRGDIDDDAFVIGFYNRRNEPVAFLTQFTGHPVTAYHCEFPVVHGEFPQVACDDLSSAFGGVPVAFLQGCAGDTNSKGLLADTPAEYNVQRAEGYGHLLGETFINIAQDLKISQRDDLYLDWQSVTLPFKGVPPREELQQRLKETNRVLQLCAANDDAGTRFCDGLNFPSNMSPHYRRVLIEPVRDWLLWALAFHEEDRLADAPKASSVPCAVLRLGDVGIIGMSCEPLLGIGRQIKIHSPTAITIPCGYLNDTGTMNDSGVGYLPDGPNCRDRDYVSAFYRYTKTLLPYQDPAGDRLAQAAVEMLKHSLANEPA